MFVAVKFTIDVFTIDDSRFRFVVCGFVLGIGVDYLDKHLIIKSQSPVDSQSCIIRYTNNHHK